MNRKSYAVAGLDEWNKSAVSLAGAAIDPSRQGYIIIIIIMETVISDTRWEIILHTPAVWLYAIVKGLPGA